MSTKEQLSDFASSIVAAATRAPDDYPDWGSWTYETHMADLKQLWQEIRPKLTKDITQVKLIEEKLQEMFLQFESGEKEAGRKIAWSIYNMDVEKFR